MSFRFIEYMFGVLYTHGHFLVQLFSQVFHTQNTGNVSDSKFGDTFQMAVKKTKICESVASFGVL